MVQTPECCGISFVVAETMVDGDFKNTVFRVEQFGKRMVDTESIQILYKTDMKVFLEKCRKILRMDSETGSYLI